MKSTQKIMHRLTVNTTLKIAATATTLLYAGAGLAGDSADTTVQIATELRGAQGSQASARFADNEVEAIGCGATVSKAADGSINYFGFCQATDAEGVSAFCATFNPELVGAINAIANYGFIQFTWNEDDECISVRNSTQSVYIPDFRSDKAKKGK